MPKDWNDLAMHLRDANVVFGHVDCGIEQLLCDIEGIKGWRDFRWYRYSQHQYGPVADHKTNLVGYMEHVVKMQTKEIELNKRGLQEALGLTEIQITDGPPCPNATYASENVAYIFLVTELTHDLYEDLAMNLTKVIEMYKQNERITFRHVLAQEHPKFCLENKMHTTGIKFYHKGRHILNYNGPIDTLALPTFLNKMLSDYPFEEQHWPNMYDSGDYGHGSEEEESVYESEEELIDSGDYDLGSEEEESGYESEQEVLEYKSEEERMDSGDYGHGSEEEVLEYES